MADPDRNGLTTKEIERLTSHRPDSVPTCPILLEAIAETCGDKFNAKRFGRRLRSFTGRVWKGRKIVADDTHGGVKRWAVRSVGGGVGGFGGFDQPQSQHMENDKSFALYGVIDVTGSREKSGELKPPNPPNQHGERVKGVL